ncbi:anaerobic ribonucleoside-triphosphate reductase activating protein [Macrococcus brunensis]|uniref:anaerobic ribonucleoside-triphosphate reductase activating protein n=1 Tax=Macrococcus brunensis TaxID=198483 RepID=UPI001EF07702|nr:anaerobic ribonucleoside-triphosphate reductase activating protein [Macrococcus brunensis]ULG72944.1 anaerobic ribonucleoside-triphosphate reductase activating protein [Macrococcus brunensis]
MKYDGENRVARIIPDCVTDGEGVRVSVYLAGCHFRCPGCFNASLWRFDAGEELTDELLNRIIYLLRPDYIKGLSILGGEPLQNQLVLKRLIHAVRLHFGSTKDIWIWTGYIKEYIEYDDQLKWILSAADVLVDGPFVKRLKADLAFRGSLNQRIHYLSKN